MRDRRRDRIKLYEIMVLIAGLAVGLWLALPFQTPGLAGGRAWDLLLVATLPLGGLSIAGVPLMLAERRGRGRLRPAFGAGRLLWFAHGMASLLLWPPIIYLKIRDPAGQARSASLFCFFYAAPLLSLFLLPALVFGGWLRRGRKRRMTSWRECFGFWLTLAWAAIGLYVLGTFYVADLAR